MKDQSDNFSSFPANSPFGIESFLIPIIIFACTFGFVITFIIVVLVYRYKETKKFGIPFWAISNKPAIIVTQPSGPVQPGRVTPAQVTAFPGCNYSLGRRHPQVLVVQQPQQLRIPTSAKTA